MTTTTKEIGMNFFVARHKKIYNNRGRKELCEAEKRKNSLTKNSSVLLNFRLPWIRLRLRRWRRRDMKRIEKEIPQRWKILESYGTWLCGCRHSLVVLTYISVFYWVYCMWHELFIEWVENLSSYFTSKADMTMVFHFLTSSFYLLITKTGILFE